MRAFASENYDFKPWERVWMFFPKRILAGLQPTAYCLLDEDLNALSRHAEALLGGTLKYLFAQTTGHTFPKLHLYVIPGAIAKQNIQI